MCWAASAARSSGCWRRREADVGGIAAVVIGTTHFTNAVVERRGLAAGRRIAHRPAGQRQPAAIVDWPEDLAALVRGEVHMVAGGHEYDGRPIVPLDLGAVRDAGRRMADAA